MEEEANQLHRRPTMTGQARVDEEEETCVTVERVSCSLFRANPHRSLEQTPTMNGLSCVKLFLFFCLRITFFNE